MPTPSPLEHDARKQGLDTLLTRLAGIAGIAALFVMVYFGVLGINRKSLELRYVARVSLVHTDPAVGNHVHVAFDSTTVRNLSKIVFRVTNVGQLPIERRDIETPLELEFPASRVLDASVMERSPQNLDATVAASRGHVTVMHGLLNPGDTFECGVLLDGGIGWPSASLRVSGVPRLTIVTPNDEESRNHAPVFSYSPAIKFGILSVSSLCPISFLIIVIGAFREFFGKLLPISRERIKKNLAGLEARDVVERASFAVESQHWATVATALRDLPPDEVLDPRILASKLRPDLGDKLAESVAAESLSKIREALPKAVADRIYSTLPVGPDTVAREAAGSTPMLPNETLPEYLTRVVDVSCGAAARMSLGQRWKSVDHSTLAFGPILLTLAVSIGLLVIGGWEIALSGR